MEVMGKEWMEKHLCKTGSFRDLLYVSGRQMRLSHALKVCLQVCNALHYLHSIRIIHRDVFVVLLRALFFLKTKTLNR